MDRIEAIERVIWKRQCRGMTVKAVVRWLHQLKYDFECEFNKEIDKIINRLEVKNE